MRSGRSCPCFASFLSPCNQPSTLTENPGRNEHIPLPIAHDAPRAPRTLPKHKRESICLVQFAAQHGVVVLASFLLNGHMLRELIGGNAATTRIGMSGLTLEIIGGEADQLNVAEVLVRLEIPMRFERAHKVGGDARCSVSASHRRRSRKGEPCSCL